MTSSAELLKALLAQSATTKALATRVAARRALNSTVVVTRDAEAGLISILNGWPELRPGAGIRVGPSWGQFGPQRAAQSLLYMASELGEERAIEVLQKAVRTPTAAFEIVGLLDGVAVEGEIILDGTTKLVPFDALPDGPLKRRVTDGSQPQLGYWLPIRAPTSCIVISVPSAPYFTPSVAPKGFLEPEARLFEAASLLAALPGCAPTLRAAWWQTVDPDLHWVEAPAFTSRLEPPPVHPKPVTVVGPEAAGVLVSYLALAEEDRRAVLLAVRRLRMAKIAIDPGDAAVDACVALEALTISNDETRQRAALLARAPVLVGLEVEGKATKTVADELNTARGKVVHGRVPTPGKAAPHDVARLGIRLGERVVQRILELGAIPKWQKVEDCVAPPSLLSVR